MIRFSNKFREDLELIYAKYTNPFDGAPELTLSTCELPENVQLIENYSKCGKWTVLEGSSRDMYADDSSDESNVDTSDEEGQSSCYDSDEQNSSNCSPSFETLFRDKYPRSCVKRASESPSMDWTSTQSTCRKSTISNNVLAKPCAAYDIDEQCKPQESYTS
ncbi:uncharacterized protein LOC114544928 isoform X2 [Dendronephthya gigantea]|uniref:uncharacterized protein LOC114519281 isoform X2 n=1 Tax=Dendronephthya gigantea TaxID=151771 RepID=UPI00106CC3EA|nr:uncharacterized protein LOC114519281 isoform X2 [Dendronephthya gigantea]XP_028419212.1 uncharacterized protein LOC114544928 isoform X2 [Dendronephthya gigantea]